MICPFIKYGFNSIKKWFKELHDKPIKLREIYDEDVVTWVHVDDCKEDMCSYINCGQSYLKFFLVIDDLMNLSRKEKQWNKISSI